MTDSSPSTLPGPAKSLAPDKESYAPIIWLLAILSILCFPPAVVMWICPFGAWLIARNTKTAKTARAKEKAERGAGWAEYHANLAKQEAEQEEALRQANLAEIARQEKRSAYDMQIAQDLAALQKLAPYEFETHVAAMFQRSGYATHQTSQSNDGGFDILIRKGDQRLIVECKRYASDQVIGRPALQRFRSACLDQGAKAGYFITTSRYSPPAINYAEGLKDITLTLVDGKQLVAMMKESYRDAAGSAAPAEMPKAKASVPEAPKVQAYAPEAAESLPGKSFSQLLAEASWPKYIQDRLDAEAKARQSRHFMDMQKLSMPAVTTAKPDISAH